MNYFKKQFSFLFLVSLSVFLPFHLSAKDHEVDLMDLSLEQLVNKEAIPLNVLGTHIHFKGEWMMGYTNMQMHMDGNQSGTRDISESTVLSQFMVSPLDMDMEMHMLDVMYGVTNRLTFMGMWSWKDLSMNHRTRTGVEFTTESHGSGDTFLMIDYAAYQKRGHQLIFGGALSLPTGSIDKEDDTPMGSHQILPYPMQLGSGTYDFLPSFTYQGQTGPWAWGAKTKATLRFGENNHHYRLGNRYSLQNWSTYRWMDWFSSSIRVSGLKWCNVHGADPHLNPAMAPTAVPMRQAGERVDLSIKNDFYILKGPLQGVRLSIEYGQPVYQFLEGPQLAAESIFKLRTSWTF